jgi:SAM-dependent methyltransferase
LTRYYGDVLPPGARVLDLMSSWISHLPDAPYALVAGLGMNAAELAANPRLDVRIVHDLNRDPRLPFDAVLLCYAAFTLSWLLQGFARTPAVFRDIAQVLSPGGRLIIAMSHRCFPAKAVRAFHQLSATDRIA